MIIQNAKIASTKLGTEDHGIFSCSISLDYAGASQSFGGYCLYAENIKIQDSNDFGIRFIAQILEIVGVENWEQLRGKHIRVKKEDHMGRIIALGNILEDKWFDPEKLAQDYKLK